MKIDFLDVENKSETEKQYKFEDTIGILKKIEEDIPNEAYSIAEQASFDLEALGYISMTYNVNKDICYVLDIDTKYTPRVTLYCLKNGKTVVCKINKTVFKNNVLKKGDVIKASKFEKRAKKIKTDTGWKNSEETEWWCLIYNKIDAKEVLLNED